MNSVADSGYVVMAAPLYFKCLNSLQRDDRHAAALPDVIAELQRKPFKNPRLQTHELKGVTPDGRKTFTSDVGGRRSDRRIVWQIVNRTILLLLYGSHAIHDRAKRVRIDFDDRANRVVQNLGGRPAEADRREVSAAYDRRRRDDGALFIFWDDAELASYGLPSSVIRQLRRLNKEAELEALEPRLAGAHSEIAMNLYLYGHPDGEQPELVTVEAEEPEVTAEDLEMERRLANPDAGRWFKRVDPDFMAAILRQPIEDWMVYLHPDQERLVEARYSGPARVVGPAGTGKTVVGLHRAAFLARRNRGAPPGTGSAYAPAGADDGLPVLFTTWVKSLPPVLESLYLRMPDTLPGEVEFINTDELADQLRDEAGDNVRIDSNTAGRLFRTVCETHLVPGTPLGDSQLTERYLKAEIDKVIKVQDLKSLDEYLALDRTGRKAPLDRAQREHLWRVVQEWDAKKDAHGILDECDRIPRALVIARQLQKPRYSAAIVDEAQDLTLIGLRLVQAVVNAPDHDFDRPDGLMLLGDAAQRIYEGGFTLARAGVDVGPRSTELGENYRNTEQILSAALAVAGDVRVEDFHDSVHRANATAATVRQGPRPLLVAATGLGAQLDYILERVKELTSADHGYSPGDIGILVKSRSDVNATLEGLRKRGHKAQNLLTYRGETSNAIKVGTHFRGKGLEFKAVFLPQVTQGRFPERPDRIASAAEAAEERDLQVARLFVAMTRARDLLFVLHDGKPSEPLVAAVEHFDVFDARSFS